MLSELITLSILPISNCHYLSLSRCFKLGQFAMPKTCEKWFGHVNSYVYCACQTHEIYQVLPYSMEFKAPVRFWNPLSNAVLDKCSFIWNEGPVNIWNACKAQSNLYVGPVDIFHIFYTASAFRECAAAYEFIYSRSIRRSHKKDRFIDIVKYKSLFSHTKRTS